MIDAKLLCTSFALLSLFTGSVQAQDELVLQDHHHLIRGKVVASTADSVTFEHVVGDTSETQTYHVADIDPHSFYVVRSHAVGDDAAAKVELGKYCAANGLYTRARNQFIEAQKLDPSLNLDAEMGECRAGTAETVLAKAQKLADQGRTKDAFRASADVIRAYPGSPAADEARKLNKAAHEKLVAERAAKVEAREAAHAQEELKPINKEIARATDLNTKGLQDKSQSGSKREFEASIQNYKHAVSKLEKLIKQSKHNAELTQKLNQMLAETKSDLIGVYMSLGSSYMTQTNYQSALHMADEALSVDANSSTAKSFRARVASASSRGGVMIYGGRMR